MSTAIHALTDMCFKKCVTSKIGAGTLDKYEEPCMQNCVDRFMDANGLILRQLESLRTKNSL
jgi:mitochondrial import inner membrane translocase subunit TIM8